MCLSPGCKGKRYLALMACLKAGYPHTCLVFWVPMIALFDPVSEQIPHSHRKFISEPSPKDSEETSWPKRDLTLLPPQNLLPDTCSMYLSPQHLSPLPPSWHETPQILYNNIPCLLTSPWHWGSLWPLHVADNWRGNSIIYLGLANGWQPMAISFSCGWF